MKGIVVREMTALVFKPTASTSSPAPSNTPKHIRFDEVKPKPKPKAQEKPATAPANSHAAYYATITFNQMVLSPSPADKEVARQLIDVYFTFFRDLLGVMERTGDAVQELDEDDEENKKSTKGKEKARKPRNAQDAGFLEVEDSNSRHVSAILTGVNRALPFAKLTIDDVGFSKHVDTLFLITHQSTFNISLQALLLLHQITASSPQTNATAPITDRYYRTLYSSLHDPRLATSNKQAMYLNLLFKSAKSDPSLERTVAFIRRFLQLLASGGAGGPEFTAGGLYLVGEVGSLRSHSH
jgi:ribosome biogenesis protein MAK21